MKSYKSNEIKNISIIGSSGSGKTTLSESMLFEGGLISRRGSVENKNTNTDYLPVEHDYGYSVFATPFHVEWNNKKLNFIDCPGADDFVGGSIMALNITSTALILINSNFGIDVGTQNSFRNTEIYNKPVIFVANQLDGENVDYNRMVAKLRELYGNKVITVQYPIAYGKNFNSLIDVLVMKRYTWTSKGGEPIIDEIPEQELEKAKKMNLELVEMAAENDEALMEKYFDKGILTENDIRLGIREGMIQRQIFPIFCVCADRDMGVRRLMEFLGNVVPNVSEMPKIENTKGEKIAPDADAPLSLYFFKTTVEPHIGDVSFFKVISGHVKEGDDLINADRGSKERISQIFCPAGSSRVSVKEMFAGDIGVTVKLRDVVTGNTLNDKSCDNKFNFIKYPAPKYSRAIKPENLADLEKLMVILHRMQEEDPTWIVVQSKELRQTIVYGQGEFHLRTLKWRIEKNDKINIIYEEPKIPYRETITKCAKAEYRHKKQSGGAGQFGEVHLIVEPYYDGMPLPKSYKFGDQEFKINERGTEVVDLEWGGKLVIVNSIVGGSIDLRFLPAIQKGIMDKMTRGPLTSSYARDVRVIIYDGKMHPVDSNEVSFMLAAKQAFSEAFKKAAPKLLEPIYNVEILVPEEKMGDVIGDLQTRRAVIEGMKSEKGYEKILAKVPLKEMSTYSTALSSITGGRSSFTMNFRDYEIVPLNIQEQLISQ